MGQLPPSSYYEINVRTTALNAAGALLIWGSTIAAVWGNWRSVAIVVAMMLATIVLNVWVNHALPRYGRWLDAVRVVANSIACVSAAVATGWPVPCWLWPPYVALAFDQSARGLAFAIVFGTLAIQDAAALLDGVSWINPLTSTVLVVYAWRITDLRLRVIRHMLSRSNLQRTELEDANTQVYAALDRLKQETSTRERVEVELRAAQRLEAIGRIAAGIAHEINTPIQFVGDNLKFLSDGVTEMLALHQLDRAVRTAGEPERPAAIAAVEAAERAADLPYLTANLGQAVSHALDGVDRVAAIVASMRPFARAATGKPMPADLNQAVHATLTLSRNEYKLIADVECALGDIPPVTCNANEINQVLLAIVVNAGQAISDVVGETGQRGLIRVTTARDGDDVVISISDTGTGIPAVARDYVFDPFFTTKDVGRGTGQGLAIARAIVERHRGRLTFDTQVGRGTTFHVRLPIELA